MNRVESLIQSIESAGLTVNKVEKTAGIDAGTIRRWKKNPPKSFEIEKKINDAIKSLKDGN